MLFSKDNPHIKELGISPSRYEWLLDYKVKADPDKEDDNKDQQKLKDQEEKYGFTEKETWALNYTLALFLYTRIKMFLEVHCIDTEAESEKPFFEALNKVLYTMELFIKMDADPELEDQININVDMHERFYEGFDSLKEIFFKLWW